MTISFELDDPRADDVEALINTHLTFARNETPLCHVFAFSVDELALGDVMLYSYRDDGLLLGVGALRRLEHDHFELKSMHVVDIARGHGVGQRMLQELIAVAGEHGARRVSLETGTSLGFLPARSLYEKAGVTVCEPFGNYSESPDNACLTMSL